MAATCNLARPLAGPLTWKSDSRPAWQGGKPAGMSFTGILDQLSVPAAGAWSMRRLSSDYEGAACTLIRASDSATLAVGFDGNGNFDAATAATFLMATTGKGTAWNDQSGNGNDASQSSDAARPAFTASAINSLPMWDFLGGASLVHFNVANSASMENLFAGGGTVVVVMAMETNADRIISKNDTNGWAVVRNGGQPAAYCAFDTGFANARVNGADFSTNAAALLIVTYDGGASGDNILFYKNGSATGRITNSSGTGSQKSDAASGLAIGARFTNGFNPFAGKIAEVMLFRSVLSSEDRVTLAADIAAYYGL